MELVKSNRELTRQTSENYSNLEQNCNELSLYDGEPPVSIDVLDNECKKIQAAFPQTPPGFFMLLAQRVTAVKMSEARLRDAVNHLLDTYEYPTPTIASILSYDRKVKIYTHHEVCKMLPEGYTFSDFTQINHEGKVRWILK